MHHVRQRGVHAESAATNDGVLDEPLEVRTVCIDPKTVLDQAPTPPLRLDQVDGVGWHTRIGVGALADLNRVAGVVDERVDW